MQATQSLCFPRTSAKGRVGHVGDTIMKIRRARRITRAQLAQMAQISREHLWAVETGQYAPSLLPVEKIAQALGIGIARIVALDENSIALEDPFVQRVYPHVKQLNQGQREHLLKVFKAIGEQEP